MTSQRTNANTQTATRRDSGPGRKTLYPSLAAFITSLDLILLTAVDIRRGFLFSGYFKVGSPSTLLNLHPWQTALLLLGSLGLYLSYRRLKNADSAEGPDAGRAAKAAAIAIGAMLVVDLFIYRGVPASRFLAAGKMSAGSGPMGLGRAIPVAGFPDWLQPAGEGLNYLLVVWHATTVGLLLGSLFLVAGAGLVTRLQSNRFVAHLTGSLMALAQPFCSCCAAPIGSALYRKGASLGPVLAFTVSAPMLNITSLILASALLPANLALLRILGGVVVGVLVTYGVSLLAARWVSRDDDSDTNEEGKLAGWTSRALGAYSRLFHFESLFSEGSLNSPSAFISSWIVMTWRLARVMVPVLLVGAIAAAYVVEAMPTTSNSLTGILVTSFFGTLLMVPTWTEIPLAAGLVNSGATGIAAAVLITLPAVSIPCLSVIAGAVRNLKVALVLALGVFATGVIAGVIFL